MHIKKHIQMSKDLINIEVEGEHIAWNNELDKIAKEIEGFEGILSELASPTNKMKVEHFQNQFLIQKNAIAKLKNEIQKHDIAIEQSDKKPFESVKGVEADYHKKISEKIDTEIKIMDELRSEFNSFKASK